MTFFGDPSPWADSFPAELVPKVLGLVIEVWRTFPKPTQEEREPDITQRLRPCLIQSKNYRRLPFRIDREAVEDDLGTGAQKGRVDLKFAPAGSACEEIFLAFECKRLNVQSGKRHRSLANEYVKDGMMRFITSQYGAAHYHGGMIGYVLDGNATRAVLAIEKCLLRQRGELRLERAAELSPSSSLPEHSEARETRHQLERGSFLLHHLFLAC